MIVKALHPDLGLVKSYLTAKANSGQAFCNVQNSAEFNVNDMVVVGILGEELTEICRISSISGKQITMAANFVNTHPENTKLTFIKYDQITFSKASSINGLYSAVSTKNIAADEPATLYDDSSALSTDYYKIQYFNSYSSAISVLSDALNSGGFTRWALISIQDSVIKRFGDKKNQFLDRNEVTDWINEGKDDMWNDLAESNEKFGIVTDVLQGDGSGNFTLKDSFKKIQRLMISFTGPNGMFIKARHIELEDEDPNFVYSNAYPWWYFNGFSIGTRPKGDTNTYIQVDYESHPADLVNDGDLLPKPLRFYTHVLLDYVTAKAYERDQKFTTADRYYKKYDDGKLTMIEHLNNITLNENRGVRDEELEVM
jgi:hypothetical protein